MDRTTLNIIEGIKSIQNQNSVQSTFAGTVVAVDMQDKTCDVQTDEDIVLYGIRLQSVTGSNTGLTLYPSVDSVVLVSVTEGGNMYVSSFAGADYFSMKTGSEDLKQWLTDFINVIEQLTVTTAVGPSGTPINAVDFEAIKQRLNNLLI